MAKIKKLMGKYPKSKVLKRSTKTLLSSYASARKTGRHSKKTKAGKMRRSDQAQFAKKSRSGYLPTQF